MWLLSSLIIVSAMLYSTTAHAAVQCGRTITANVVVLDNPTVFNRLGAQNPNWITYALKRDVVHASGTPKAGQVCQLPNGADNGCAAGRVELRPDKRPRPLVVRSAAGDCLKVTFTNLLDPNANPNNEQQGPPGVLVNNDQVRDRRVGDPERPRVGRPDGARSRSLPGSADVGCEPRGRCRYLPRPRGVGFSPSAHRHGP